MKQECRIWNVWMLWLAIPGIALVLGLLQGWWAAVVVIVAGTAFQLAYVRWFPRVSRWLGYGSVADVPAQVSTHEAVPRQVTLYTARGCPFCPIIRQRIAALRGDLGFELVERDVTFQPRLLAAKGIQSVPVVQAGGQFLARQRHVGGTRGVSGNVSRVTVRPLRGGRTMRSNVAVSLLALSMLAATDAPWPSKGDAVFIAASFKGIQHPKLVSGASMNYDMVPCKQFTVTKANAKKLSWAVKDPLGNQERLEGEWVPWMFKTEDECKSQSAARGEPKVVKSGMTFTIAPGGSGTATK